VVQVIRADVLVTELDFTAEITGAAEVVVKVKFAEVDDVPAELADVTA
jgi:hypothetical protein